MKKRSIILLIIGIILIVLPFLFQTYNLLRLVSLLLGILLCTLSIVINQKHIFLNLLFSLLLIAVSYGVDMFLYYQFNFIPIYSYEVKSNEFLSTYNSFFYRIYNCNNNMTMDYGYNKNYLCSDNLLKTIDVNDLLKDPLDSYKKYKNKFIKVHGKISSIIGKETISLSSYKEATNNINGYVDFNLNNSVKAIIDEDLSTYRIYDYIDIIGRVDSLIDENGKSELILKDTVLIKSKIYDDYTYEIKEALDKELIKLIPENNYYYYGISSMRVIYDDKNVYDLSYLLTDTRFTWNNLVANAPREDIKDELNEVIGWKYTLDKYNLLECKNNKKIIASKKMNLNKDVCEKTNIES